MNYLMTIQMCLSICRSRNFEYAGLEWQNECYCGDNINESVAWAWQEACKDKCAGDSNQICGGSNAISLWKVPPERLEGICVHSSPTNSKILNELRFNGIQSLTVEKCQQICKGKIFISI